MIPSYVMPRSALCYHCARCDLGYAANLAKLRFAARRTNSMLFSGVPCVSPSGGVPERCPIEIIKATEAQISEVHARAGGAQFGDGDTPQAGDGVKKKINK